MKKNSFFLFFVLSPLLMFSQWNSNLSENLPITPPNTGYDPISLYSNNGYFFSYSDNYVYKINRYNTDGTPNWPLPIIPNNRNIGGATYTKYDLLDSSGNLVHISSFEDNSSNIHYCASKIATNGTQLWNGDSGIEINDFVIGAYISQNDDLFIALQDNTLLKYNASGILQWTTPFYNSTEASTNANIIEKSDGSIGIVFFNNIVLPPYGNYYYTSITNTGTLISTLQIESDLCRFYSPSKILGDDNNNVYFLFTDQNDKGYIQKIANDNPVYSDNGYAIDIATNHASIFESAIIKDGILNILYNYYEVIDGQVGIMNQKIDLTTFTRIFPNGNVLLNCNSNDIETIRNGMIIHDNYLGFLALDKLDNSINYKIFDGNSIIQSYNVCTTPSGKNRISLSTLNNINASNAQIVVLFTDDRNYNYEPMIYAQNLLFSALGNHNSSSIDNKITVYPNPSSSFIHIKSYEKIKKMELYSALGQLHAIIYNTDTIDISNLSVGEYYLKIELDSDETIFKKLIKV